MRRDKMLDRIKKIVSVCLSVVMLFSLTAFVLAEDVTAEAGKAQATMRLTVGEADKNGIFHAKLTVHNAQFLVMAFVCSFNEQAIQLVNEEGKSAKSFSEAVDAYPAVIDGEAIPFTMIQRDISNESGEIEIAAYLLAAGKSTNVVTADAEGFLAYDFRFKKIGNGDYGFALKDTNITASGKGATLNDGRKTLDVNMEFVYPEEDQNTSERVESARPSRPSGGSAGGSAISETERLREARKAGTVILQIQNYAVSVNGTLRWFDQDNKQVVPYIEDGRTMVPLRFVSEAFGAYVKWIPETRSIQITLDDTKISMQIDNTTYTMNDQSQEMDVAPVLREDRTMVPLRCVSEALQKSVYWNEASSVVVIAPIDKPWDDTDAITQQLMMDTLWMMSWLRDEAYAN